MTETTRLYPITRSTRDNRRDSGLTSFSDFTSDYDPDERHFTKKIDSSWKKDEQNRKNCINRDKYKKGANV